ncbi:MAG TPA: ABC transporter ATP-binding protein [Anaerolineales bacterium]|jgi:putative ABC transport system ATP-binding protein|nr:ABC transporter ATP-binding protein [Anaerolineales bacterium]
MSMIKITNLTKHYSSGEETVEALRGIDVSIAAGEFVTIMGHSGSGKSTLLSVLGGMNHPTTGEVEMAGIKLYTLPGEKLADFRSQNLGFVFQAFHLIPYLTAQENVMLPLVVSSLKNEAKREAARKALEQVGLGAKIDRLPNQLSGGEQERVAIARAIVNNPQILLADEPTGNLDSRMSNEVMALFRELNGGGQTVVMVTHNPDNCAYADRTIYLRDGRVVDGDGNEADSASRSLAIAS